MSNQPIESRDVVKAIADIAVGDAAGFAKKVWSILPYLYFPPGEIQGSPYPYFTALEGALVYIWW